MMPKFLAFAVCLAALTTGCGTGKSATLPTPPVPEAELQGISQALLMGDPEKAVEAHERAFKNAPQDASTRILHARLLILAQRVPEAKKELDAVLAKDPLNPDALYARSLVAALEGDKKGQKNLLEKAIAAKQPPADAFSSLGSLALDDRNYDKARAYFTRAREIDGQNLVAAIGLGNVNFKRLQFKEAEKYFNQAVAIAPDYPFSYSDRALVKRHLGDLDGALADLDTAVKLEPDYSYNYFDRGRIYLDKGRWREAIAQFTLAIQKEPDMFAAFVMRGGLYDSLNRLDEALSDYETVLKLRPDYYFAYSLAGTIDFMKDRPAQAFDMFSAAFSYQEKIPEYALLAALALKKDGREKEAGEYLKRAVAKFPRDGWQYDVARFYLSPESDNNLAVIDADHERNKVERARILFYLAEQYLLLDKKTLARTYFSEAAGVERKGLIEKRLAQFELDRLNAK